MRTIKTTPLFVKGQKGVTLPYEGHEISVEGVWGQIWMFKGDQQYLMGQYESIERAEAVAREILRNVSEGKRAVYYMPLK